ncbi:glutathione peroxidase [Pseudomarimonas salicorniae]|uniref:Glutathione peroxidase n=1 Tax=Pseudomarimonas salicorniae TaxID=2933270 RepID=A0ABT0GLT1_9GAMM|nr:glutathione peroxidase [Lysobacter sp. CAU 1642]MCK7595378.1 glutathione peroxidase [Lysobacter sp. CAU 1642]
MNSPARLIGLVLAVCPAAAFADCAPLLDHSYRPLAGKQPVHLCEAYADKVVLVVNTASKCGFTPQYEGLEALHQELGERGFAVIGFPSNDFMGQEPGSEEEIRDFCTNTYGVKFPMFEKVSVTGDEVTPLYRALAEASGEAPGWNFHKYLIDRDGKFVASYGSRTKPDDAALRERIEALLAAPAAKD